MKFALIAAACAGLFAASAAAQTPGSIYFTLTSSTSQYASNCNTSPHGVSAVAFSVNAADTGLAGGGVSRPSLSAFSITRAVDTCTESLLSAFLVGGQYKTLTLTQYGSAGGKIYPSSVFTLSGVVVSSFAVSGSNDTPPAETLSFSYEQMCVATTTLGPTGTPGSPVSVCYDQVTNQVL